MSFFAEMKKSSTVKGSLGMGCIMRKLQYTLFLSAKERMSCKEICSVVTLISFYGILQGFQEHRDQFHIDGIDSPGRKVYRKIGDWKFEPRVFTIKSRTVDI